MIQPINDIVLVEPTYNMSQILAINQAWYNNAMQLGIVALIIGLVIGHYGPLAGQLILQKYGSRK